MAMQFLVLSVLLFLMSPETSASSCGDKDTNRCVCYKTYYFIAKCDGKKGKHDYIPKLPKNTNDVEFINNNINHLSRHTLTNLTSLNIKVLNLMCNNINYIDNDTFIDLKNLKSLDLSGNKHLSRIQTAVSFSSLPKTFRTLKLNHLLWYPVDVYDLFNEFHGSMIGTIEFSHSYLSPFNGSWFQKLKYLRKLDISWNSIEDSAYNFSGLSKLSNLNLEGNWFNNVPDFCRDNVHLLRTLSMKDTKLYALNELWYQSKCLTRLKRLNLSGLSIRIIPNNIFSELESLKTLYMSQMSSQLHRIRPYAFNSSTLTNLTFSRSNGFLFFKKMADNGYFNTSTLFAYCSNIQQLDLSHNFIELTDITILKMFSSLSKLRKLWLEAISISYMPTNFLPLFPNLEFVSFEKNAIGPWKHGVKVFGEHSKLKKIILEFNKIFMIYESSFPPNLLHRLKSLHLAYNQMECNCDLKWFKDWLKTTKIVFKPQNLFCNKGKMKVLDYNPTFLECHVLAISMSVGFSAAVLVVIITTVYCCRWRIRYQLYNIRSHQKQYERLPNTPDQTYMAYIIYSDENLLWVKQNLIPRLEDQLGYKLCIPHRDFELGKVLADNIVDHMNGSQTVIPILSNHFAKNEWCLFQLAVARNKISRTGNLSIFPIMLEEIEFKYMNSALYHLIKMSNYAAWSNDDNGLELFWDKVISHLQKQTEV